MSIDVLSSYCMLSKTRSRVGCAFDSLNVLTNWSSSRPRAKGICTSQKTVSSSSVIPIEKTSQYGLCLQFTRPGVGACPFGDALS